MGGAYNTNGGEENIYIVLVEKTPKEGEDLEDLDVDGRIILKGILKYSDRRALTKLIWLWVGGSGELLYLR